MSMSLVSITCVFVCVHVSMFVCMCAHVSMHVFCACVWMCVCECTDVLKCAACACVWACAYACACVRVTVIATATAETKKREYFRRGGRNLAHFSDIIFCELSTSARANSWLARVVGRLHQTNKQRHTHTKMYTRAHTNMHTQYTQVIVSDWCCTHTRTHRDTHAHMHTHTHIWMRREVSVSQSHVGHKNEWCAHINIMPHMWMKDLHTWMYDVHINE